MMKKEDIELEFGPEKYLKLEKEFREKQPWLFTLPQEILIDKKNPPILVYQMGKVGSTSVVTTLNESGISNPVYHVHQMRYDKLNSAIKKNIKRLNENKKRRNLDDHLRMYRHLYLNYLIRQLENHLLLRKKFYYNAYEYVVNNVAFGYKFCKKVYSSKYIKHFYSKDEIENFIMKWTRGGL